MSTAEPPVPRGLVLQPFRALRFAAAADLASLTSPPYDVIDPGMRTALEARAPHNVVRLILPRDGADAGAGDRYQAAAALLERWTREGVLIRDDHPALHVYEQTAQGHVSRGLVGAVALARAEDGVILPHENTMAGPVEDRLALLRATATDLEPIFLVYAGDGTTARLLEEATAAAPTIDVTTDDGVRHRLWPLTDAATLDALAADLLPRRATIADGHHRYATYLRYQEERHAAGDGPGPWDFGLAFVVDATAFGPQVHAIHRVVPGLSLDDAVQRAATGFHVEELTASEAAAPLARLAETGREGPAFVVTDGTRAFLLLGADPAVVDAVLPDDRSAAWKGLDVVVAHAFLVRHLWGLADTEDVVGFAHDVPEALAAARAGGGIALLLNPTPVAAVAAVAEAGERMPRKSTLFTPKPATGALFRPLDGAGEPG